ncbi:diaminopimelate decarboxylase [Pleomorphomonas sp. PLEO]|uniref:diaminopimelate decarboxylase n=1 Tax=Pleomorphomonas sp. PLEO TaxID=3239306 RepID=UPI00351F6714
MLVRIPSRNHRFDSRLRQAGVATPSLFRSALLGNGLLNGPSGQVEYAVYDCHLRDGLIRATETGEEPRILAVLVKSLQDQLHFNPNFHLPVVARSRHNSSLRGSNLPPSQRVTVMIKGNRVSDHPLYRDDQLTLQIVEKYHTPTYVFDEKTVRMNAREIMNSIAYRPFHPRYACKALTIGAILNIVREEGFWIDASSINEVDRALRAGFKAAEIYYTGEGATLEVYSTLVQRGILVNCTSIDQIRLLGRAGATRCSLRLNPGEGHGANHKTNTGGPSSKHGIYFTQIDDARSVAAENGIKVVGVHSHIGSGTDLSRWLFIKDKTLEMAKRFPDLEIVNLGGGFPVIYDDDKDDGMPLEGWGNALSASMDEFSRQIGRKVDLQIEPGRFLVAGSGVLLAEAQAVKTTDPDERSAGYNFVIVNTGLNHNIRPSLYGAFHPIRFVPRDGVSRAVSKPYVVAGYLCESGDVFTVTAENDGTLAPRVFPEVRVGDIMVMAGVGAYSHSMKSEYNSMNLPASILIEESGHLRVIERRGTLDDLMRRELEAYDDTSS